VAKSLQRRLRVLVTAAAVGLAVWKYAPSFSGFTELDRVVFETSVRSFANPPYFVSGNGSHDQRWTLRTLSEGDSENRHEAPSVISIGDDPDGVFQSSPPSAVDYAVILRNLKRLGVRRVAIPAVMAWDESDPIALTAVDARLAEFESAVTAAPLTRGAIEEALPMPFLLASIPVEKVKGDVSSIPLVNRLAFPRTFLGSGKTLAGFSILESEPGIPALMARWKDRIVFSFPVVAALAEAGQAVDQIEVRLGSYMKLGSSGPVVPIDASGRLASPALRSGGKVIPAQAVIDAAALETTETVLIRDDRTSADQGTKGFSGSVADTFIVIRRETGLSEPKVFGRLAVSTELTLLLVLAALLAVLASTSISRLRLHFGAFAILILIAQLTVLAWGSLWLPLYPSLCSIAAGYLVAWPVRPGKLAKPDEVLEVVELDETLVTEESVGPLEVERVAGAGQLLEEPVVEPPAVPEVIAELVVSTANEAPPQKSKPIRKATAVPAKKAAKKATHTIAPDALEPAIEKPVKKVAKKATPAKKAAKKTAKKTPQPPPAE